tara:strand:- start:2430 stop:2588 length:159 start_codon:yes stop_codon:yes gene_type:complete
MQIVDSVKTGITSALQNPLGACLGVAYWILCLGVGAWAIQWVINFVFRLNGF